MGLILDEAEHRVRGEFFCAAEEFELDHVLHEGVLTGGGSGRLIAEIVTGAEPYADVSPFRPDR